MNAPDRAAAAPHLVQPRRRLRLQDRAGRAVSRSSPSPAPALLPKELLVGIETADDAAVYQINEHQAIVATTDFFMPIVDDPFDFGAIAATNAISDVYAMGGTPLFALALVGMPIDKLPVDTIRRILEGGESVCAKAGIPVAGGHTIDSVEPIYGLVAIGLVDPKHLKRNAGARPGDLLVLGKPLGVGVYSAALKKEQAVGRRLRGDDRDRRPSSTRPAFRWARLPGVHALTDVTGFGLLGHLLEICRGSRASARPSTSIASRCIPACSSSRARGTVHRRVGAQLGGLRQRRAAARGLRRREARAADRSADLGRAARRLRAGRGRRRARVVPRRRLRPRRRHRRGHRRTAARRRALTRRRSAAGRRRSRRAAIVRRPPLPRGRPRPRTRSGDRGSASRRAAPTRSPAALSTRVRAATLALAAPLSAEDCALQSMPDASPVKWHLAHTTWFFETFVLERARARLPAVRPALPACSSTPTTTRVGDAAPAAASAACSRGPSLDEVLRLPRARRRGACARCSTRPTRRRELARCVELGLHHEQQHQELILTDVKHLLSRNPLQPAYRASAGR